MSFER